MPSRKTLRQIHVETRPWGEFHLLDWGEGFKIKRIIVGPQGCLSLQHHKKREEHWIGLQGMAHAVLITPKGMRTLRVMQPGSYLRIPVGVIHRIENPSREEPFTMMEVQLGPYLEEDDIVRHEDIYGRP